MSLFENLTVGKIEKFLCLNSRPILELESNITVLLLIIELPQQVWQQAITLYKPHNFDLKFKISAKPVSSQTTPCRSLPVDWSPPLPSLLFWCALQNRKLSSVQDTDVVHGSHMQKKQR